MNIRYPNITNAPPLEQLAQIRSFLFQLVEQLNMEAQSGTQEKPQVITGTNSAIGSGSSQNPTPVSTFNQIKSLIIKSADIVDAYYEEINKKLEKVYVAESEFGTYSNWATAEIQANAERIRQTYESIQELRTQQVQIIATKANIRSGLLFVVGDETLEPELGQSLADGTEVYGVEVGQETEVDGKVVFNKFARFTAYGMTLYDNNEKLTAYITDRRLNIPNMVIKNTLTRGGFQETINSDGGSVERWVGV